jgi:hypothetical protein
MVERTTSSRISSECSIDQMRREGQKPSAVADEGPGRQQVTRTQFDTSIREAPGAPVDAAGSAGRPDWTLD